MPENMPDTVIADGRPSHGNVGHEIVGHEIVGHGEPTM